MEEEIDKKPISRHYIIGINIAVLAVYTILCKAADGGLIIDALLILMHFIACIIIAVAVERRIWILSAFVILLIGFSSCVELLGSHL